MRGKIDDVTRACVAYCRHLDRAKRARKQRAQALAALAQVYPEKTQAELRVLFDKDAWGE